MQNVRLLYAVEIDLTFSDGQVKKNILQEGDYILACFRYNGQIYRKACKIIRIEFFDLNTEPASYVASLVVDCYNKKGVIRIKIASKNIINLLLVNKAYVDALKPDYIVTDDHINGILKPGDPLPEPDISPEGEFGAYTTVIDDWNLAVVNGFYSGYNIETGEVAKNGPSTDDQENTLGIVIANTGTIGVLTCRYIMQNVYCINTKFTSDEKDVKALTKWYRYGVQSFGEPHINWSNWVAQFSKDNTLF